MLSPKEADMVILATMRYNCSFLVLQNADIPIIFCLQRVLLLLGLFYTGLLPFIPFKEEFLEIPMPSIILK